MSQLALESLSSVSNSAKVLPWDTEFTDYTAKSFGGCVIDLGFGASAGSYAILNNRYN